jgi:hypothetical protein
MTPSLQAFQTPNILANTIRMHRQVFSGSFLLVEGESDKKLLAGFCDPKLCSIKECKGKDIVVGTLNILEKESFDGILAIIDRDFENFTPSNFGCKNLLLTSDHDSECMLINSGALARVLRELASEAKLAAVEKKSGPIGDLIGKQATIVGCLRLISHREKFNLKFKGMRFSFVEAEDLSVDVNKLVRLVISRTEHCALKDDYIVGLLKDEQAKVYPVWQICNGHDAVQFLSLALRQLIGSKTSDEADHSIIERELRLAFHIDDFQKTQMWSDIRSWESRNIPYRILS